MLDIIYLDGEEERDRLVSEIGQVRQEVLRIVKYVPEDQWYEPRYHGWSLAAMLGHLNLADNLSMLLIKAALIGFRPRISMSLLSRFNDFTIRLFQKRLVSSSCDSVVRNQKRIDDMVRTIPIDRLSTRVFSPADQKYVTIEYGIQQLLLHHWHRHLQTMYEVEGIQPPDRTETAE
jgi:hypothetical protein